MKLEKFDEDGNLVEIVIYNYDPETGEYLGCEVINS